jgi:hypothetical protein
LFKGTASSGLRHVRKAGQIGALAGDAAGRADRVVIDVHQVL